MGDVHFMISETAKRVGVESHVLRYWEEELALPIGRTEMGHRHYTEEDIQLFCCIKELKEQGMQLKEIKEIIPDMLRAKQILKSKPESDTSDSATANLLVPAGRSDTALQPEVIPCQAEVWNMNPDIEELRSLFGIVVQGIIAENNKVLEENICKEVVNKVTKDMDFLLQAKERQEEDRYRKLDHLIRQQQCSRKEAARMTPGRCLRRIFNEN